MPQLIPSKNPVRPARTSRVTVFGILIASMLGLMAVLPGRLMAQPATAATVANALSPEYRLGGGDVVRISVYQNPDLTLEVRVAESGTVSYPLVGALQLGGRTVSQAEALVANGLRRGGFIKDPQVSVLVLQVRGNQANVLGQVNRPGRYPLEVAGMRLTDLLAMAGGATAEGSDMVVVTGQRKGEPFRTEVDLPTIFSSADPSANLLVQDGDNIFVNRAPRAYIYGEVQRPGLIQNIRGLTLLQVLASAGGLSTRGTERGIRLHRTVGGGRVEILTPALTEMLRDGDVIYVRESLF